MIKVTLEFSSQEDLVAFFTKTTPTVAAPVAKVEAPKSSKAAATPAAGATAPAKSEPAAAAPTEKAADPKPTSTGSSAKPSDSVDYPTLQKAVFALANADRAAAGDVAATFGVKTFKELDASKWGEALIAVTAKLAQLQAA